MTRRTPNVEIRLLGHLQMYVDGAAIELRGRRPRALLAVLALSAGRPLAVETLYERVWGEELPGDVRGYLYSCVRRLRAALGDEAISNAGGRYTLHVAPDAVDALRFADLLDHARGAPTEQALLREALRLWRGTPFTEPLSEWLNGLESRRLTELYLGAVERRVDAELADGEGAASVAELQELAAAHPLREPLWARLLLALDRAGRQAEALAAYDFLRKRLADELGIDPSRELQGIYAGLLDDTPTGSTRTHAARRIVVPRQLPAAPPALIGRQDALDALDAQLADAGEGVAQVAISVLHGMGGVGKTETGL